MIIDRIQLFFIIIDHYTINNNMVNYLLRYSVILIIGYNNNGLQAKRYGLMEIKGHFYLYAFNNMLHDEHPLVTYLQFDMKTAIGRLRQSSNVSRTHII